MDFLEDDSYSSRTPPLPGRPLPYSKVLNDPIHGHIELDEVCMHVIDTPQFQRLRDLKQLGSAYFVFPGAANNRFEHCIGVCHLAGVLVEHLRKVQPELGITDNDVKCVKLAGLCHDLGHGPFSHVFDNEFMKQARPGLHWTHEKASEDLLQYLVDDNEHVNINSEEIRFIKDLIHGAPRGDYPQAKKLFLFDIVANQRNSVDVDKFDYIQRDCHNVGIKTSLDARRLMTFARVIDDQICFNQKEAYNLYEMFHTRFSLFKRVYTHKVGKAVEYMLSEALLAADAPLGLSASVDDMRQYMFLTDSILKEIERSSDPQLEKSRAIIKRIRKRDLYRFVDQILVPLHLATEIKASITADAIVACQEAEDHLIADDVIVEWLKLGYAMKDRNPVDNIGFFSKWHPDVKFHVPKEHVSSFIPNDFEEITLRVYARNNDKRQRIQQAFRKLVKQMNEKFGVEVVLEAGVGVYGDYNAGHFAFPTAPTPSRQVPPQEQRTPTQSPYKATPRNIIGFASPLPPVRFSPDHRSLPNVVSPIHSAQTSPIRPMRLEPSEATLLPPNYTEISSPARKRVREDGHLSSDLLTASVAQLKKTRTM
ncbi:hypothetical protein BC832DRAFT_593626 [Gaertneriomyces semiglobifer]|nr:hypothetical protein BC832DRAFT_593626 [Gaertneriomyces semiglobifer]